MVVKIPFDFQLKALSEGKLLLVGRNVKRIKFYQKNCLKGEILSEDIQAFQVKSLLARKLSNLRT